MAHDSGRLFAAYLTKKRPVIEAYLAEHAPQPEAGESSRADMDRYAYAPLAHFTEQGGKRTRPALVLLGCEAVGGDAKRALSSAAAIEYFQSAALIHDDIADEGKLRRGEPCTYITEGTGVAINIGDLGIVHTFRLILDDEMLDGATKLSVLHLIAQMEQRTVEGQAMDLGWTRDGRWDITADDYMSMARHKTAYYSAATPLSVGALCGGGTKEQIDALHAFGMDAGLAFQLQDDLLNLVGDAGKQGKDFRTDITEGKRTLAVAYALGHLPDKKRSELISILSARTEDEAELARAVALMDEAGAIEYVRSTARGLAASAKQQIASLAWAPDAQELLSAMADFFVERVG